MTFWVIFGYLCVAGINTTHVVWKTRPTDLVEALTGMILGVIWPVSIPLYWWASHKL
jgi:hypothetical protein